MKKLQITLLLCLLVSSGVWAQYWKKQSSPTTNDLYSISFANDKVGYICGSDSLLLKTTDGGFNWFVLTHTGISSLGSKKDYIDLNFLSADTGYLVIGLKDNPVYRGELYKTTDGGLNWFPEDPGNVAIAKTFFFDDNNAFVVGSAFFSGSNVLKKELGNWKFPVNFNYDPYSFLKAVDFRNKNVGIVGGDGGYVYRTFDAGLSWDTVKTNVDSAINELVYLNDTTILAATDDNSSSLIISHDSGKTWSYDIATATFHYPQMNAMVSSEKDSLVIVGTSTTTGKGLIYSFYAGSWASVDDAPDTLWDVAMAGTKVAYIVGDSGLIMTNRDTVLSIDKSSLKIQGLQVFPNPVSTALYIQAQEPIKASIWSLQGILLFASDQFYLQQNIDLNSLPSAVYLLSLEGAQGQKIHKLISKQ